MRKTKLITSIFVVTLSFNSFTYAQATSTASIESICTAMNSINLYTVDNMKAVQLYLRAFFPKVMVTGGNDPQTKYYLRQFQNAYGLARTGMLDEATVKFIKGQNKCYSIETKIVNLEATAGTRRMTVNELLQDLLKYISGVLTASGTPTVSGDTSFSVELSTTTKAQVEWQKQNPQ